jgi:ABC-type transport system involved in cytochrome bd biosynthesis fused ATPase/permease subunit
MLFKNIPKRCVIRDFILTILWSLFNLAYIRLLSLLVENYVEEQPVLTVVIAYFAFLFIWEIIEFLADVMQEVTNTYIEGTTRIWALNEIYELKPSVIKQYNTGYINGVVSKYIRQNSEAYGRTILFAPLSLMYVIYCVVMMWNFHVIYGVSLLGLLICGFLLRFLVTGDKQDKKLTELEGIRDKLFIDNVSNINTIQKMQAKDFVEGTLQSSAKDCRKQTIKWAAVREIGFSGYKLVIYIYLPIVCFLYIAFPDTIENKLEFFSFLSVIAVQLVHTSKDLAMTLVSLTRFNTVKKKLLTILAPENKRRPLLKIDEFRNAQLFDIEFQYDHKEHDESVTIKIPYFHLSKGDKICLYGESGQGKSTLLNILSGEIETNGIVINGELTQDRLECVFIAQDTEILDMSLRDNLTLGNKSISDEQIIELLEKCGLKDWYDKQEKGLDTLLGERGTYVSTGQRQRLNIIRGLLISDKEIYLLDEPTSNVDEETEEKLIKVIKEYLADKTMVVVTHRPKIKEICNKAYKFTDSILGKEEILKND